MGTSSFRSCRVFSVPVLQRLPNAVEPVQSAGLCGELHCYTDFLNAGFVVSCQGRADVESAEVEPQSHHECYRAYGNSTDGSYEETWSSASEEQAKSICD